MMLKAQNKQAYQYCASHMTNAILCNIHGDNKPTLLRYNIWRSFVNLHETCINLCITGKKANSCRGNHYPYAFWLFVILYENIMVFCLTMSPFISIQGTGRKMTGISVSYYKLTSHNSLWINSFWWLSLFWRATKILYKWCWLTVHMCGGFLSFLIGHVKTQPAGNRICIDHV